MDITEVLKIVLYIVLIVGLGFVFLELTIILGRINEMILGVNKIKDEAERILHSPKEISDILTQSIENSIKNIIDYNANKVMYFIAKYISSSKNN